MTPPNGVSAPLSLSFSALREGRVSAGPTPVEAGAALSDAQLVALARESHAEAFELLYAAYKGRIYTFILRMVIEPELADDITQDVFMKVYPLLPRLDHDHRVLPWLYRVASNAAIDQIRRRRRFAWLPFAKVNGTHEEPHSPDDHQRVGDKQHVTRVLRGLPPENASALLLHALEGYSYKEIADIQGVTMTAVRSRIARARQAFKRDYEAST